MKTTKSIAMMLSVTSLFVYSFVLTTYASSPPATDYTMQTLYIFNFIKYVEWPGGSKAVKIGVVDNASAEEYLMKMAKAKSTTGSAITVINTRSENELGSCQIIFIPSNSMHLADRIIEHFSNQPILIVTEEADFTEKGASVSFKIVSGKLRFQLNENAIKSSGLKVANALLALAEK